MYVLLHSTDGESSYPIGVAKDAATLFDVAQRHYDKYCNEYEYPLHTITWVKSTYVKDAWFVDNISIHVGYRVAYIVSY